MLAATLILAALVLFTAWDAATDDTDRRPVRLETEDRRAPRCR